MWTLLLPLALSVPQDPWPAHAVDAAVERGVAALLADQELDGAWPWGRGRRIGCTALVLYTLLRSGVHPEHAAIQRGFAHLEGQDPDQTYDAALLILALAAHQELLGDERHTARIAALADRLLEWQQGDWGYPSGDGDLSNTQYAALGLWAAGKAGFEVGPRAWDALASAALEYGVDGGFAYHPEGRATGSMTAAGVGVLSICRARMGSSSKRSAKRAMDRLDEAIEGGIAWLDRHWSVTENPGQPDRFHGYYLYGLERVGGLAEVERIGGHDWYAEVSQFLVQAQSAEGDWGRALGGRLDGTAFALLLLRRATHPWSGAERGVGRAYSQRDPAAPLRLAASGDSTLAVWIAAWGDDLLRDVEWPEDAGRGPRVERVVWRVDGTEVARLEGDREHPAESERFAHQVAFTEPGTHAVVAEVQLAPPPRTTATGRALPAPPRVVVSAPLEVRVENVCEEWMLENARDYARALPAGRSARIEASSAREGGEATLAIDGDQDTSWLAAPDDEHPTLRLAFAKPVVADTIVVGHARSRPYRAGALARALEVEVVVNKDQRYRLRMHADERRKGRLVLPREVPIKTLELVIPLRVPGDRGEQTVGIAEVELQRSGS